MSKDKTFDVTIAPWVLPREDIPIGIVVHAHKPFRSVNVEWPSGVGLVSTINVAKSERGRRKLTVTGLASGPFDGNCYFGLILRHKVLPATRITFVSVKTRIAFDDGTQDEAKSVTRVGRPFLEIVTRPTRISLRAGSETELPLSLKYSGFGDIEVRIQAKLKGKIVSYGDSLIHELTRRLLEVELASETADTAAKPSIEIDREYVRQTVEAVETFIRSDSPLSSMLDPDRVKALRQWLQDSKARRGVVDAMLTARINQLMVSILQELLGRSPVDGITLKNARTSIDARIEAPVTRVQLEIDYTDKVGNKYAPLQAEIEVEDETKTGERRVRIPITITNWAQDPLLNISGLHTEDGGAS